MLNKKILAVAIAAGFTMNANAAITLSDTTADLVTYATETYSATDLNADGLLPVSQGGTELDVITNLGFTIAAGTSKYVRFDLSAGEFDSVPALTGTNVVASVSTGGDGEDFVIFEVTGDNAGTPVELQSSVVLTMSAADYLIDPATTTTVTYTLYETAANAVNQTAGTALSTASEAAISTGSASTGTFTVADTAVATVASEFTVFDDPASADPADTLAEIAVGAIDTSKLIKTGTFLNAGTGAAVVVGDLYTTPQDVNFAGDFTFGDWTTDTAADCSNAGTAVALSSDKTVATAANLAVGVPVYLCVDNTDEDTVKKGSYSVTLVDDKLTNTLGKIAYNTTSVEVPYITTYADYNQRFYLINNGVVDSQYSFTFTSEDGVTATPGAMASGVIPAGEVLSLKASDVVTLSGKTRTSAVIEVEAEDDDFSAATQTVNLSNAGTDTTVLN
ncbi:hypothetical protein [Neptunicella sp. SCSIO 80796]|uniref:hypothetical protein n=1 Tax=Neptunicella plasticusilytica TaxID=3117012 RepID=UPI003A4D71BE